MALYSSQSGRLVGSRSLRYDPELVPSGTAGGRKGTISDVSKIMHESFKNAYVLSESSSLNPSSSSTFTLCSLASSSFEPAPGPATT